MNRSSDRLILVALAALSAVAQLSIMLYSTTLGLQTVNWPSTSGTLLRSTWRSRGGQNSYMTPDVLYRYRVDGAVFEGDRLQFGPTVFVEDRIRALPEGSTQRVYFDRSNPARSTLTTGIVWPTLLVFAIAFVLSLLAAGFFWRLAKRRQLR